MRYLIMFLVLFPNLLFADDYQYILKGINYGQYDLALERLEPLVAQDEPNALYIQAMLYYYGFGVKLDREKATDLFKRSAELGNRKAMLFMSRAHSSGKYIERNIFKAESWLEKHGENASAEDNYHIGRRFFKGTGAESSIDNAEKWFQRAFVGFNEELKHDPDNSNALYRLGMIYLHGYGRDKDLSKAMGYFQKAYQLGEYRSTRLLGLFYKEGGPVDVDEKKADKILGEYVELLKKETVNRKWKPAYKLGRIYEKGFFAEKDIDSALHWYMLSAKHGYTRAMLRVGAIYAIGDGVEQDNNKACMWAGLAYSYGFSRAANLLHSVRQSLSEEEKSECAKQVVAWENDNADTLNKNTADKYFMNPVDGPSVF